MDIEVIPTRTQRRIAQHSLRPSVRYPDVTTTRTRKISAGCTARTNIMTIYGFARGRSIVDFVVTNCLSHKFCSAHGKSNTTFPSFPPPPSYLVEQAKYR